MSVKEISNILIFLNKNPELELFVKEFNDKSGFFYSSDPRISQIIDANEKNEYTNMTFPLILKACQAILLGKCTIEQFMSIEKKHYDKKINTSSNVSS